MEKLEQRIERFLRQRRGEFEPLALELFRYQFERNAPYQAFCRAQQRSPDEVRTWQEIPAVPVGAFKNTVLSTAPASHAAAVFHSSQTTGQTPSRHFLRTLTFYETALKREFEHRVLAGTLRVPFLLLVPPPSEAPHSSLTWMLDVVARKWSAGGARYFVQRGLIQTSFLIRALEEAQQSQQPVVLLGTTLAFLRFFEACEKNAKRFRLPSGSRLMDTGGMKKEDRQMTRDGFVALVETMLGIPEAGCINEYGMCELSSQFYAQGRSTVFAGPPWVRTVPFDLVTGEPAAEGKPGLLRHWDLANVDSAMAIQTEDLGVLQADGFILQGRAPAAELRGCALTAPRLLG